MWCPSPRSIFQPEAFWTDIARRGFFWGVLLAALVFLHPSVAFWFWHFLQQTASEIILHFLICNDARILFCGDLSSRCPSGILNRFDMLLPATFLSWRHHSPSLSRRWMCIHRVAIAVASLWLCDWMTKGAADFQNYSCHPSLWRASETAGGICSGGLCIAGFFLRKVFAPPSYNQNTWTYL